MDAQCGEGVRAAGVGFGSGRDETQIGWERWSSERCIPLAWQVYPANSASGYPPQGQARLIIGLLKAVRAGVPKRMKVRVLADRGIGTSPLLMRGIQAMGLDVLVSGDPQEQAHLDQWTGSHLL
jgi:hypothetical protein